MPVPTDPVEADEDQAVLGVNEHPAADRLPQPLQLTCPPLDEPLPEHPVGSVVEDEEWEVCDAYTVCEGDAVVCGHAHAVCVCIVG